MRCKDQGFSLIEVLITFVLIGIGTLGLIKLQAYIEKQADYAIYSVEALNLANHIKIRIFFSQLAITQNIFLVAKSQMS